MKTKTCPDCNGDGVVDKDTDDERQCPTYLGVWDAVAPRVAQAENVRAALAFVARGETSGFVAAVRYRPIWQPRLPFQSLLWHHPGCTNEPLRRQACPYQQ